MNKILLLSLVMLPQLNAFLIPTNKPKTNFKYVGDTKPLGYFDPLKLTENLDSDSIKYLREAEIHHGRIAMSAIVTLPVIDAINNDLAINFVSKMSVSDQFALLLYFSLLETIRLNSAYVSPMMKRFKLKSNFEPGNYFGIKNIKNEMMDKELNNGRLAMIAALGYISQELLTGIKIL